MCEKAKYFMWLSFTMEYVLQWSMGWGDSDNQKIQFKFLETFELSYLWFINNRSQ